LFGFLDKERPNPCPGSLQFFRGRHASHLRQFLEDKRPNPCPGSLQFFRGRHVAYLILYLEDKTGHTGPLVGVFRGRHVLGLVVILRGRHITGLAVLFREEQEVQDILQTSQRFRQGQAPSELPLTFFCALLGQLVAVPCVEQERILAGLWVGYIYIEEGERQCLTTLFTKISEAPRRALQTIASSQSNFW
jgi:hypothetical protein